MVRLRPCRWNWSKRRPTRRSLGFAGTAPSAEGVQASGSCGMTRRAATSGVRKLLKAGHAKSGQLPPILARYGVPLRPTLGRGLTELHALGRKVTR